jgi:hypothetical protein
VLSFSDYKPQEKSRTKKNMVKLGHIGRLSKDKNFDQMIDLLITLNSEEPGRFHLTACGTVHSAEFECGLVEKLIYDKTGRDDIYTYIPPVNNNQIVELMRSFDYFLFFSTSNLEVLGRVLIECAYSGTKVLAANHAAAAELVDPSSLLEVDYLTNQIFNTHFDHALGKVDIEKIKSLLLNGFEPEPQPRPLINNANNLINLLNEPNFYEINHIDKKLNTHVEEFISRISSSGLSLPNENQDINKTLGVMKDWFCSLNEKKSTDFNYRLSQLKRLSRFPNRTEKFINSVGSSKCDFTNLGGLDMELCNVVKFYPEFYLSG